MYSGTSRGDGECLKSAPRNFRLVIGQKEIVLVDGVGRYPDEKERKEPRLHGSRLTSWKMVNAFQKRSMHRESLQSQKINFWEMQGYRSSRAFGSKERNRRLSLCL